MLDLARVVFCLSSLAYASWSDIRTREVSDLVWLVMAPVGLLLTAISFHLCAHLPLLELVTSLALIVAIALALVVLKLAGSADALALISMGLALPLYPEIAPIFKPRFYYPFLPLAAFTNGVMLSAAAPTVLLLRNAFDRLKGEPLFEGIEASCREKAIALCIGYRAAPEELRRLNYLYPIEMIEDHVRKLRITIGVRERDLTPFEGIEGKVWVTPGLPMVFSFTIGLLTSLLVGDFISALLSAFR